MSGGDNITKISGLSEIWARTLGNESIRIAVIDGPVDRLHPAFAGAHLDFIDSFDHGALKGGPASLHGTHVASILFGQHDSPIKGIVPRCHGIIIPVFKDGLNGSLAPASELDLAQAISRAFEAGAHVINISGGQLSETGSAHPLLEQAVVSSVQRNVLIVAAAGNDGCACLHVPGALPSVLAVGAINPRGEPLDISNWGYRYKAQGISALGENISGAKYGGGEIIYSGTSVATPIVSGVAGLLLSLQLMQGESPNPQEVRHALLQSAQGCEYEKVADCRRLLKGRLNINGAMLQISKGGKMMANQDKPNRPVKSTDPNGAQLFPTAPEGRPGVQAASCSANNPDNGAVLPPSEDENEQEETMPDNSMASDQPPPMPMQVAAQARLEKGSLPKSQSSNNRLYPSACSTDNCSPPQLVFAIGQLYYDIGTDARRDSLSSNMGGGAFGSAGSVDDPNAFLNYLEVGNPKAKPPVPPQPWDSAAVIWTLNDETTPIYALQPDGPYAQETYARLRQFLREQIESHIERVSIAGYLGGKVRLYNGMEVPVIFPDLRGMYNWNTEDLVKLALGPKPAENAAKDRKDEYHEKFREIRNLFDRVYSDLRNLGLDARDRAVNFAATNAFNTIKVFERASRDRLAFESLEVERSPVCRPDSDCWDVKLIFFNPHKPWEEPRLVMRFTVDVSDVVPVLVGDIREWYVR